MGNLRTNQSNISNMQNSNRRPELYINDKVNEEIFVWAENAVNRYSGLSTSQLRNFYNEVKNIEKKVKRNISENYVLTRIKLLKAKVRYNRGRNQNALNRNFADDIEYYIDKVKNLKDFKAFCILFEALVGFFYGSNARSGNR